MPCPRLVCDFRFFLGFGEVLAEDYCGVALVFRGTCNCHALGFGEVLAEDHCGVALGPGPRKGVYYAPLLFPKDCGHTLIHRIIKLLCGKILHPHISSL